MSGAYGYGPPTSGVGGMGGWWPSAMEFQLMNARRTADLVERDILGSGAYDISALRPVSVKPEPEPPKVEDLKHWSHRELDI